MCATSLTLYAGTLPSPAAASRYTLPQSPWSEAKVMLARCPHSPARSTCTFSNLRADQLLSCVKYRHPRPRRFSSPCMLALTLARCVAEPETSPVQAPSTQQLHRATAA